MDSPTATATDPPQTSRTADRRRWLILGVLCASVLVVVLDGTIVNVALPTLATQLGASTSQLQWIVDAYVLVFAGLLMAAGSFGDRVGRKWVLMGGLGLFATFSALGATSGSANALIAMAGGDGRRRRADVPRHPGDPRQRLHGRQGARRRHRRVGGHRRPRGGPRPGHGRVVARALLVGLGADDQRARRHRRPRADRHLRAELEGLDDRPLRPPRHGPVDRRHRDPRVGRHRGPGPRLGVAHVDRRLRPRRRAARRLHRLGAPHRSPDARRLGVHQHALHRRVDLGDVRLLRPDGVRLPGDPVLPVRAGLQHARRRRSHRPVRHLHRLDRPPVGKARRTLRHQADRHRRPGVDGRRVRRLRRHRRQHVVLGDRGGDVLPRRRPRPDPGPGHRSDHGLVAARQGRRRLGGQRHRPRAREHARRRHRRQRVLVDLRLEDRHRAGRLTGPAAGDRHRQGVGRRGRGRRPAGRPARRPAGRVVGPHGDQQLVRRRLARRLVGLLRRRARRRPGGVEVAPCPERTGAHARAARTHCARAQRPGPIRRFASRPWSDLVVSSGLAPVAPLGGGGLRRSLG